ncbi:MAG TPA: hypothetical protein DCE42_11365 [Myxococcales bacterium]|nr:hypothetical protein [Deltaproteobacteria bacterium]MBU49905.1 hypothetical protein [Deltaproteobacteria bacterium]HAA55348.1 hypothetical protein [Myxococcales bacterium]
MCVCIGQPFQESAHKCGTKYVEDYTTSIWTFQFAQYPPHHARRNNQHGRSLFHTAHYEPENKMDVIFLQTTFPANVSQSKKKVKMNVYKRDQIGYTMPRASYND